MDNALTAFAHNLQVEGYSPETISAYRNDLAKGFFVYLRHSGIFELASVTTDDIRKYFYDLTLEKHDSNFTRKRKLASMKSFFKYLLEAEVLKVNPVAIIKSPKLPDRKPAYLTEAECLRLLQAVARNAGRKYKERDLTMIILFLHTGLRVSELINLKLANLDLKSALLRVNRKGNKEQSLHLNNDSVCALERYLSIRQPPNGYIFVNSDGQKLSRSCVYNKVKRYLLTAGISKSKWGPHVLRHTFCTRLHQKGVNPLVLRELAGHRSLNTTMKYVSIEDKEQTEAVDRLELGIFRNSSLFTE
jgi:integrase/recombinase XerD